MAETKALISSAVTAQLIWVFVLAYAIYWFSHAKAQIAFSLIEIHFNLVKTRLTVMWFSI